MTMMKAGETLRLQCDSCSVEFEVTLEPKAKGDKSAQEAIDPESVEYCPFCGDENVYEL